MKQLKLGSLFDGSGGFPLAGVMNGIEPVWASEIEPFPIRVTKQRFPNMKHLGSVTDINGAEIEPVDIVTFGSPCQDLSVAGKQAGIHDGERSSLFFEAVRIIKEMREHDRATGRADVDIRPRFAVWENVPGAFSSNKGADFQAVLQALCEIEGGGKGVSVPMPSKGKWLPAGCIVGNGYSIAWRVYDAQYWGVPQRRKRIYLIADFGSERAGEILFESESVPGDHQPGEPQGQRTADNAERSAGRSNSVGTVDWINIFKEREGGGQGGNGIMCDDNTAYTLATSKEMGVCYSIEGHVIDRKSNQNGRGWAEGYAHTINATDRNAVCFPNVAKTLTERYDSSPCIDRGQNIICYGVDCRNGVLDEEKTHTVQAHNNGGFSLNCTPSVVYSQTGYADYAERIGTLKASGGDCGGGSESIIVECVPD